MNGKRTGFGLALAVVLWSSQTWAVEDFVGVTNGGFEVVSEEDSLLPAGWFSFFSNKKTMEISQTEPKSGSNCLKMSTQGVKGSSMGIAQSISVDAGKTYTFTVYIRNNGDDPLAGEAHGMIGIEWKNSHDKEISRITSPEWDMSLSRMRWDTCSVSEKAPRGAKTAVMAIFLYDGEKGGSGSCFVDDAQVEVKK